MHPVECISILVLLLELSVSDGFDGGFRDVAIATHNEHRARLSLSPLTINEELNGVAHAYAEKLGSSMTFASSGPGYGDKENLWAYYGRLRPLRLSTRDAVNAWYTGSEVPGYTLVKTNSEVIRSNETTGVGIGVGTNEAGYTVVVANYS